LRVRGPGLRRARLINRRLLCDALKLNEDELPILVQTVGRVGTTLTSLAD
jgi:hypothetical protein